ncbi:MAG TPA: CHAT domain-containing protein [Gemmatimonadaceae bacterium]|nr:CHAT domain-containing protein [Gemmatimonadaceae bacterium]
MTRTGRLPAALLFAAVVGGLVVSGAVVAADRRGESSELGRLASAVGPHRVTRARLTGGFAYAPCDTVVPNDSLVVGLLCRTDSPRQWPQYPKLVKLAGAMRAAGASGAIDASRRHASGSWSVVWGNLDAAIDELRAAARVEPTNATIQSDLAAALLARAGRNQDPQSILEAYTAADRAVTLDARLPEARFNQALALEWLQLRRDALAAWSSYLTLDSSSPWADEARAHQRSLRVANPAWHTVEPVLRAAVASGNDSIALGIARRFPSRVRDAVSMTTVEWARAYRSGSSNTDALLSRALVLARALAMATTDSLWLDAVESIVRSAEQHERARLDVAARGFVASATGSTYVKKYRPDSAAPFFVEAEAAFSAIQNAARFLAGFDLARAAWLQLRLREAHDGFRRISTTTPSRYRAVRALAARAEGLAEATQADFPAAAERYLAAIAEARGTGDPVLYVRSRTNLAENLAYLGLDREAWSQLYAALRTSDHFEDVPADGVPAFSSAAWMSWRMAPLAALSLQEEAVRLARRELSSRRDSMQMIGELRWQAELSGRAGRPAEAFETLRSARAYIATIDPDSVKAIYEAEADLVEGSVLLHTRPESALKVLQPIVEQYRHSPNRLEIDRALLLLASAYAAVGVMDSAQEAFEAAIAETERRRSDIASAADRARFLDQARPVIDSVVSFLVTRNDTIGALEFVERMRSQVLLERVLDRSPNATPRAVSIDSLRSRLPSTTSVVSFAVLDKEVITWLIRRDGVFMYRSPGAAQLEPLVTRLSTSITRGSAGPELRGITSALYRLLIAPFEAKVEPESRLIFVPDKWLHFVPFAALFDTTANKFVVERFDTGIASSLQLYVESLSRYGQLRESRPPVVLVVGNPSFDARLMALPPLPGAEAEAKRVAALYRGARVLVGSQATKRALLQDAAVSNIVHFAGHGVVRPDAPLLSHLVLAPGDGDLSGILTAQELFDTRLPRTRLAILSGCHTASGRLSDTEGASSLARALFGAGVPAVVASLWAVDDESTADFFASYHRRLSRGDDPTEALRRTQLEWLAQNKGGWQGFSTWAAFALYGATTEDVLDREKVGHGVSRSSLR